MLRGPVAPTELELSRAMADPRLLPRTPNPPIRGRLPIFDAEALAALIPDDLRENHFEDHYTDEPTLREKKWETRKVYRCGPTRWIGDPGTMLRVTPLDATPRQDNIFDGAKLGAVVDAVREGRGFITEAPYAFVSRIDPSDVGSTQRAAADDRLWEWGIARPFTTGDALLDAFLADADRAEEEERPRNPLRWREAMKRKVETANRLRRGDLGHFHAVVRDGNHRVFGSFLGGAPCAWVTVPKGHRADDDPAFLRLLK